MKAGAMEAEGIATVPINTFALRNIELTMLADAATAFVSCEAWT